MSIRTITYSYPDYIPDKSILDNFSFHLESIKQNFSQLDSSIYVRTARLSLPVLTDFSDHSPALLLQKLSAFGKAILSYNFRWFNLTIDLDSFDNIFHLPRFVCQALAYIPNLFINFRISSPSAELLSICSQTVNQLTSYAPTELLCFRFGISTGNLASCPFFPYSYFDQPYHFSLGLEAIPLFDSSLSVSPSPNVSTEVIDIFSANLSSLYQKLYTVISNHKSIFPTLEFDGVDASLAPFPRSSQSLSLAFKRFGLISVGHPGTSYVVRLITSAIKSSFNTSPVPPVGFNGCMFSVLEDDGLADSAICSTFSYDSLLLFSTLCGCGIDMVPVSGTIMRETINNMILDIVTLARSHCKPLGFRILPQVGKTSSDVTSYSHDFIANTRVFSIQDTRGVL